MDDGTWFLDAFVNRWINGDGVSNEQKDSSDDSWSYWERFGDHVDRYTNANRGRGGDLKVTRAIVSSLLTLALNRFR